MMTSRVHVNVHNNKLGRKSVLLNDHTIGWQNLNPLSHPNATLAPQARQARPSGEILNYSLSH